MNKICTTPKSEARQLQFQDTLFKIMAKQRFETITVVLLCKEMGVSRKTFYQYFDTLEDVLYQVIDREVKNGFLRLEVHPEIKEFFLFWKERKWLLDVLEKNGMSHLLINRSYYDVYGSEKDFFSSKYMKKAGYISAILTVLILWHHGGMKQSIEEMEKITMEMFYGNEDKITKN